MLLWDGEANLLALVTLLVVELWQWVLVSLFAGFTMAEGIECQEDGVAERDGICLVVACHIVAWGGVGCCMDDREAGGIEHAILVEEGVEWHGCLVVVHRHDAIELVVVSVAEEIVGWVRTECLDALLGECIDGWDDDVALLGAAALFLVDAWVEGEHSDAWVGEEEVALQGVPEQGGFLHDAFLGD